MTSGSFAETGINSNLGFKNNYAKEPIDLNPFYDTKCMEMCGNEVGKRAIYAKVKYVAARTKKPPGFR